MLVRRWGRAAAAQAASDIDPIAEKFADLTSSLEEESTRACAQERRPDPEGSSLLLGSVSSEAVDGELGRSHHQDHASMGKDTVCVRERRKVNRLIRDIEVLETRVAKGESLDKMQLQKINRRTELEKQLVELMDGMTAKERSPPQTVSHGSQTSLEFGVRAAQYQKCPAGAPHGLLVADLGATAIADALVELRTRFQRGISAHKKSSAMFEVGWSFQAADHSGLAQPAEPLSQFPNLRALLAKAMRALGAGPDLGEAALNVICRHYSRGQGIPLHVDRREMFHEDVFGCVLQNSSDRTLEFRQTSKSGEVLQSFQLDERPGVCFLQRGEARFSWSHGLEPSLYGERFSVTWRWFTPEWLPQVGHQLRNLMRRDGAMYV